MATWGELYSSGWPLQPTALHIVAPWLSVKFVDMDWILSCVAINCCFYAHELKIKWSNSCLRSPASAAIKVTNCFLTQSETSFVIMKIQSGENIKWNSSHPISHLPSPRSQAPNVNEWQWPQIVWWSSCYWSGVSLTLASLDSTPTVNIFLLCGKFPISLVLPVCRISTPGNWRD